MIPYDTAEYLIFKSLYRFLGGGEGILLLYISKMAILDVEFVKLNIQYQYLHDVQISIIFQLNSIRKPDDEYLSFGFL